MGDDSDDQLGVVSNDEQKDAIENKAHRLAEGQGFLKEFYSFCSAKSKVSVDKRACFCFYDYLDFESLRW